MLEDNSFSAIVRDSRQKEEEGKRNRSAYLIFSSTADHHYAKCEFKYYTFIIDAPH